jgi:hypothetical protein
MNGFNIIHTNDSLTRDHDTFIKSTREQLDDVFVLFQSRIIRITNIVRNTKYTLTYLAYHVILIINYLSQCIFASLFIYYIRLA